MAQAVLQRPVSEPSDDQEFTSIANTRRQNTVNNTGAGNFIYFLKNINKTLLEIIAKYGVLFD